METITINLPEWLLITIAIILILYFAASLVETIAHGSYLRRRDKEQMKGEIMAQVHYAIREQVSFDNKDEESNFIIDLFESISARVEKL